MITPNSTKKLAILLILLISVIPISSALSLKPNLPFGAVLSGGNDRFTFTGQEKDKTGLMYYGARYYDPFTMHFTQPDTILPDVYDPQQLNRYAYVRNNPVKYTDETGNCPMCLQLLSNAWTTVSTFAVTEIWPVIGPYLMADSVHETAKDIEAVKDDPSPENIALASVGVYDVATPGLPEGKIAKGGIKGSKGFFSKAGDSIKSGWNKVKSVFKKSDEVTQSFENKEILVDHFTRHGSKMGYTSPSTYEKDARNFLSGKPQLNTAEMIRSSDKALVRYQFNTQKLGVLDADGTTIKTFLKPYDDPIESYNYYLKQINKR